MAKRNRKWKRRKTCPVCGAKGHWKGKTCGAKCGAKLGHLTRKGSRAPVRTGFVEVTAKGLVKSESYSCPHCGKPVTL